jgi:hypothetical protein
MDRRRGAMGFEEEYQTFLSGKNWRTAALTKRS